MALVLEGLGRMGRVGVIVQSFVVWYTASVTYKAVLEAESAEALHEAIYSGDVDIQEVGTLKDSEILDMSIDKAN